MSFLPQELGCGAGCMVFREALVALYLRFFGHFRGQCFSKVSLRSHKVTICSPAPLIPQAVFAVSVVTGQVIWNASIAEQMDGAAGALVKCQRKADVFMFPHHLGRTPPTHFL